MLTYKRDQVLIDTLASYKDLPHLNKVKFRLSVVILADFFNFLHGHVLGGVQ